MNISKLNDWRKLIQEKQEIKMYKHFDSKLNMDLEKDFKKVEIAIRGLPTHQFLPFVKRVDTIFKYRRKKCNCGQLELGNNCKKDCSYNEKERKKKIRPLMYASNLDSYIYSYCNYLVSDFYEAKIKESKINNSVTAYRKIPTTEDPLKNKCNIHFASEAFNEIKKYKSCVVITADITGFFDHLNHSLLKDKLQKILGVNRLGPSFYKVYKSLTQYKHINYYPDFKNKKVQYFLKAKKDSSAIFLKLKDFIRRNKSNIGIPQGSSISGLFSNIYMYDFDLSFDREFPDVFYRRYSDDIFIICSEEKEKEVKTFLFNEIKRNKLKIEPEKTNISYFLEDKFVKVKTGDDKIKRRNYVDYLGFEFYGEKTLMRKKSLGKLRDKQEKKAKRMIYNTSYTPRPKKVGRVNIKSRYLKKSIEIFKSNDLGKQIRSLSKRRNKVKKDTLFWKTFFNK